MPVRQPHRGKKTDQPGANPQMRRTGVQAASLAPAQLTPSHRRRGCSAAYRPHSTRRAPWSILAQHRAHHNPSLRLRQQGPRRACVRQRGWACHRRHQTRAAAWLEITKATRQILRAPASAGEGQQGRHHRPLGRSAVLLLSSGDATDTQMLAQRQKQRQPRGPRARRCEARSSRSRKYRCRPQ